jgi:hypothetical protein
LIGINQALDFSLYCQELALQPLPFLLLAGLDRGIALALFIPSS